MTRSELCEMMKANAPKWMREDYSDSEQERQDPLWYGDDQPDRQYDFIDYIEDSYGAEYADDIKWKRAATIIDRAVGAQRKLKEGEFVYTMRSSGSKTAKAGDWVHEARYIEVTEAEVAAWNKHASRGGGTYVWDAAEYEFELNAPHRVLEIEAFHAGWSATKEQT